jgi:hypothetical protein
MSIKKFRFVSPGIFVNEIDKSQLGRIPVGTGPVVIGRAARGPSMVPVTVNSYLEFVEKFGEPDRGAPSEDVWRSGETTSPLYATYAAKAYLRNSSPLTFVRLVGEESPNAASGPGRAGWNTTQTQSSASLVSNGGAYGLFIVPSGSNVTGTLAAVWYINTGSIRLVGNNAETNTDVGTSGGAVLVKALTNSTREFRAQVVGKNNAVVLDTSFNFSEASSKYIRKAFNTNPTLTNESITVAEAQETYWLGETFTTSVDEIVTTTGNVYAFVAPLQTTGSVKLNNFTGKEAESAKSGWVISQDFNSITGSFSAESMPKLFRFVVGATAGGEAEQKKVKVSISDIKPSTNDFYKFGSFTVQVRDIADTDSAPVVLEQFTNCTLDPNSPDYIAAKIGDEYLSWDETNRKYMKLGNYPVNSNYVRVEMHPLVEEGGIADEALPFGFFGPPVFKDITLTSGSAVAGTTMLLGADKTAFAPVSTNTIAGIVSGSSIKLKFPSFKLLVSASQAGTLDPKDAYYGIVTKMGSTSRFNQDVLDLVRPKPFGVDSFTVSDDQSGLLQNSFVFTLDDVVAVPSSSNFSYWQAGSRAGTSTVNGTSISALAVGGTGDNEGYKAVLSAGVDKFTMPLFGGTDGLNIREKDPFRNSLLSAGTTEDAVMGIYALKKAIDTVKDPDVVDLNMIVVPGVTNTTVTKHVVDVCENRADALAIIDLPGGYIPSHESTSNETARRGSVNETVTLLKQRTLNSSYACTYYPWVKINDEATNTPLWVPPSVVALGTMASSQERTELWFAPAGFNRGGLTNGSAGLPVLDVREKLTAKQRDKLYENNINPIASFPNEGIVIFGQKTLQVTPSALDRINVRRLMIYLKKEISRFATTILFDQNVNATWNRFKGQVEPFLTSVQARFGVSEFKMVLDNTTTTPDLVDRNILYAKIYVKPARAIEFIALDFIITRSGASFDD